MESKVNYTAVGAFVVGLLMALAGAVWWLGSSSRQDDMTTYVIYASDNVTGLSQASDVQYRGVKVGRVTSIDIDPANPALVRIEVALRKDVPVRADTVAQLSPRGLTGLSVINLSGGHSPDPLLPKAGHRYAVIHYEPSVFSRLEGGLSDATLMLSRMTNRLNQLLSDDNVRALSQTLQHLERVSAVIDAQREDIAATLTNLRQGSEGLAQLGARGQQLGDQASAALRQLQSTAQAAQRTLGELDGAARQWQQAGTQAANLGEAGTLAARQLQQRTLPDLERLGLQLQQLSGQLTELGRSLQHNPNQLLFGAPLPPPGPGEH